jgi:hypothetical protein
VYHVVSRWYPFLLHAGYNISAKFLIEHFIFNDPIILIALYCDKLVYAVDIVIFKFFVQELSVCIRYSQSIQFKVVILGLRQFIQTRIEYILYVEINTQCPMIAF